MDRLAETPELLDGPLDDRRTLIGNLHDLRRVNRWLGGIEISDRAVAALEARQPAGENATPLSLLDVGTGAADIPLALITRRRAIGTSLRVTGLDSRPEVLAAAAAADPALTGEPDLVLHIGDGRSLPYPDAAFDIVHASLVHHHLDPDDVHRLLVEMGRVARLGIVVNDLARGRLAYAGAWLLAHTLTTNRFTRHDAPLSVRRAYRPDEMAALMAVVGLEVVARFHGPFRHRYALAAVAASER